MLKIETFQEVKGDRVMAFSVALRAINISALFQFYKTFDINRCLI
jgi:hypothetical protein